MPLEFEWVMRGFCDLLRRDIQAVLRAPAGIEHLQVEDRARVLAALDAFEGG